MHFYTIRNFFLCLVDVLSVCFLWFALGIAEAKSRTGKGQLDELKAMSLTDVYATFGGQDRISRLDLHFKRVRTSADVAILSFGYVNVIKKTLEFVKLSEYFENMSIIGCDSAELKQVHGNKAQCIEGMKKKRNLKYNQVWC